MQTHLFCFFTLWIMEAKGQSSLFYLTANIAWNFAQPLMPPKSEAGRAPSFFPFLGSVTLSVTVTHVPLTIARLHQCKTVNNLAVRRVKVKIVKIHCRSFVLLVLSCRTRQHWIFVFIITHLVLFYPCSS